MKSDAFGFAVQFLFGAVLGAITGSVVWWLLVIWFTDSTASLWITVGGAALVMGLMAAVEGDRFWHRFWHRLKDGRSRPFWP